MACNDLPKDLNPLSLYLLQKEEMLLEFTNTGIPAELIRVVLLFIEKLKREVLPNFKYHLQIDYQETGNPLVLTFSVPTQVEKENMNQIWSHTQEIHKLGDISEVIKVLTEQTGIDLDRYSHLVTLLCRHFGDLAVQ